MPFNPQPSSPNFRDIQQHILEFRKRDRIFEQSIESKDPSKAYRFYDGPPFVTGTPHYGSLLSSVCKDVIPRYQTMKGHRVDRVWGWDCHGIYIEQKVQKKLGLESSAEIEKFGVRKFIEACYEYTKSTSDEWNWYVDNIGRWVDMFNAYKTQDNDYMESVMRVFKQLRDKGLIYKGKRVSMFSTKLSTPISNFEVAMDDTYEEINDPAITVAYKLTSPLPRFNQEGVSTYILIRTTTPRTIPANMAAGVHQDITYSVVAYREKQYVVAQKRVEDVFKGKEYEIRGDIQGKDLVGLSYKPPYNYFYGKTGNDNDHKIYHADFASDESGTGLVHEAPEFGEVDFQLAQKEGITISEAMDEEGKYTKQIPDKQGKFYRDMNEPICDELAQKGVLFDKGSITHRVAFCPRSGTPLVYKAQDSRFVDIQSIKEKLLAKNEEINRFPSHFKYGRFAKSLESAPDRCISRTRYRGSPMPVWTNNDEQIVLGSREELYQRNVGEQGKKRVEKGGKGGEGVEKGGEGLDVATHNNASYVAEEPKAKLKTEHGTLQTEQTENGINGTNGTLTRWILVRHGETGVEEYGQRANMTAEEYSLGDIGISEQGQQQAQKIADDLQSLTHHQDASATIFVLSPLKRVIETMAPYFKEELEYDILADKKYQEIFAIYQKAWKDGELDTLEGRKQHVYHLKDNIIIDFRVTQYAKGDHVEGKKIDGQFFPREERVLETQQVIQEYNQKYQGQHIILGSHGPILHTVRRYRHQKQVDRQPRGTIKTLYFDGQQPWKTLTKIIFVRHGRTDYNDKHLADYEGKAQLTDLGAQQAQDVATSYADTNVDVIYSSPLQKCQDMIAPLAQQKNLSLRIDERLREHISPALQDQPFNCHTITRDEHPIDGEKGESILDVYRRVSDVLQEIVDKHQGQTVVICSHGDPLVLMRKYLRDFDYAIDKYKWYIDNKEGQLPVIQEYVMNHEGTAKRFDLHKPWIDQFLIKSPTTGKTLQRLSEVLDPWMDSASMPYAQVHYPFENKEKFEASFPADYIVEYTGQIRAWFYVMHVLGVALFDKPAYTNVVCTGVMNGNDGRKMSKSFGNYPDPKASFEKFGGDAIRMAMLDSPIVYGGDMSISKELFVEKIKTMLLPLRNAFYFFTTYARIDDRTLAQEEDTHEDIKLKLAHIVSKEFPNFLDRWLLSEVHLLIKHTDEHLALYNMQKASQCIFGFLDNLTNWYIRRSRRRFWKSQQDDDKHDGYAVLFYTLVTLAKVVAPFMPFLSEYIYRELLGCSGSQAVDCSVHLSSFPEYHSGLVNQRLSEKMQQVQTIVSLGLSRRSEQKIRVRQPLGQVKIGIPLDEVYQDIIADELNVKTVIIDQELNNYAKKIIKPDGRQVGKKFGKDFKEILRLAKQGDFVEKKDGVIRVGQWELYEGEYEIDYLTTSEDIQVAQGIVMQMDATITPALEREGYARDLVRYIQEARKEAGYDIADRILLSFQGDVLGITDTFDEYIQQETLATFVESIDQEDLCKTFPLADGVGVRVEMKKDK